MASPLTSWLRVPLAWYASSTYALYPDETAPLIRRTYTSPTQPSSLRHFCGFCGTPLSYWTENPEQEAAYINLTLGSLSTDDLRDLEELGLIPPEVAEDAGKDKEVIETAGMSAAGVLMAEDKDEDGLGKQGLDWFEAMVEGSRLGKANTRRHGERRGKGWRVEWEIVEWVDGEEEQAEANKGSGKRKLGDVEDVGMEG